MRIKLTTITLLILFISSVVDVSAQTQPFSKDYLSYLRIESSRKLSKQSYRSVQTYENFNEQEPQWNFKDKTVFEFALPNSYRRIDERNDQSGYIKNEWIFIGKRRFKKTESDAWEEVSQWARTKTPISTKGTGSGIIVKPFVILKKEMGIKFRGQKVDYYEIVTKSKTPDQSKLIITESYWFDMQRRIVKKFSEKSYIGSKSFNRKVSDYEYDVNLTIDNPIENKRTDK